MTSSDTEGGNDQGHGRWLAGWVRGVTRWPALTVLVVLLLTGLSGYYASGNLGMETDPAQLLDPDLPYRQVSEDYKRQFPGEEDNLLVLVEAAIPERAEALANQVTERLRGSNRHFRGVDRSLTGPFFQRNAMLYRESVELEQLGNRLAAAQPLLAQLVQDMSLVQLSDATTQALSRPEADDSGLNPLLTAIHQAALAELSGTEYTLSWQRLFNGEDSASRGTAREVLQASPRLDYDQLLPASGPMKALDGIAQDLDLAGKDLPRLRTTGDVALQHQELQSALQGAKTTGLVGLALVCGLLLIGFRSIRLVALALVTLTAGLILTAGFAALAVGNLNLISIAFAVLYIGLGIDYAVHFILRYRELRRGDHSNRPALTATGGEIGGSLVLCAISTSIGFYAFLPTAFSGVSELGLIAGTSMFISLFLSLTLLPALVTWFPARATGIPPTEISPTLLRLVQIPLRHRKIVLLGAATLAMASVAALPRIQFDYDPLGLRSPQSESVQAFRDLMADDSKPSPMPAIVLAPGADNARETAKELEELDSVGQARTLFDFVPDGQREKLDRIENLGLTLGPTLLAGEIQRRSHTLQERLESLRELRKAVSDRGSGASATSDGRDVELANTLDRLIQRVEEADPKTGARILDRLEGSLLDTLPENLEQLRTAIEASPISLSDLPDDLRSTWVANGDTYRIAVFPQEELATPKDLRGFVTDLRQVAPDATGSPVLNLEAGDAVVSALGKGLGLALVGISLVVLVLLRRWSSVITVLGPLLLAALATLAATVALGISFNFANIIALPLLLGIGVDSGIHMVHREHHALPRHGNLLRTSTARAVIFSTLTSACGFGALAFSPHPGTASMGQLLTLGAGILLIMTLVVLPALIRIFDPGAMRGANGS